MRLVCSGVWLLVLMGGLRVGILGVGVVVCLSELVGF